MNKLLAVALSLGAGLGAGVVLGYGFGQWQPGFAGSAAIDQVGVGSVGTPPPPGAETDVAAEVRRLKHSVATLQQQVTELAGTGWFVESAGDPRRADLPADHVDIDMAADHGELPIPVPAEDAPWQRGPWQLGPSEPAERNRWLEAAGVYPEVAEDITRRIDNLELRSLELTDQAAREGWLDSERYRTEREALQADRPDLREELGEKTYEQYLWESGMPNRVQVTSVLSGSAAAGIDLRAGDIIDRYDGVRILQTGDLTTLIRDGERGEIVSLSWFRSREVHSALVPRGPLGIRMHPQRVEPSSLHE